MLLGLLSSVLLGFVHISAAQPNQLLFSRTPGEFDQFYNGTTPSEGGLVIFTYTIREDEVMRVRLYSSNASHSAPLLAVFREPATIISAQLPARISHVYQYSDVARTLCPFLITAPDPLKNMSVSIELSSVEPVNYAFIATKSTDFRLILNSAVNATASASQPIFFEFDFTRREHSNLDSVVIEVSAPQATNSCIVLSIEPAECPVFDLANNVIASGMHQTMTTTGSITVQRREYTLSGEPLLRTRFFVVLVVHPDITECTHTHMRPIIPPRPVRSQDVNFTIQAVQAPNESDYLLPIFFTFIFIILIYASALVFVSVMNRYDKHDIAMFHVYLAERAVLLPARTAAYESRVEFLEKGRRTSGDGENDSEASFPSSPRPSSPDDMAELVPHYVDQLSVKDWRQRNKKLNRYWVSLLTVGLFYCLPVVQLVLTWQGTLSESGNQDICYYNFKCARPLFIFFAFNNVLSNIGYVSLGILFLLLVKERDNRYKELCGPYLDVVKKEFGLPHHNGIMYTIGIAIIMEGVLSASYHICPSRNNYQFDTSFMYIIGMLGMIKIYQLRHPDLTPNAQGAFAVAAFFIFVAMIGVFLNNAVFWSFFTLCYLVTMFLVSVSFYYKDYYWRHVNLSIVRRNIYSTFKRSRFCSCLIPANKGRFLFILIGNALNLVIAVGGFIKQPADFPSFLIAPFIGNLFLFLFYYIIMKYAREGGLRMRAVAFLCSATVCWVASMWFFLNHVADWSESPADSRALNQECLLFDFYDNHDIWHFLSATAIFMSFSLMNCIDDDLMIKPRNEIVVF